MTMEMSHQKRFISTFVTTDYDKFMEKALKDKGRNPVTEFCRIYSDPFVSESVEKKSEY
jgi:hypothetical protein